MSSCFSEMLTCFRSCIFSDWSQPLNGALGVGGGVGFIAGAATGNLPLAVVSAGLFTSSAVGTSRVSCLKPWADLGRNARSLQTTTGALAQIDVSGETELQHLAETNSALQSQYEAEQRKNQELEQQRKSELEHIAKLTAELESAATSYQKLEGVCTRIQQIVQADKVAQQQISVISEEKSLDSSALLTTLTLIESSVQEMNKQNQAAAAQNAQLKEQMQSLLAAERQLQEQILKLTEEKEALQKLVGEERNAAEIEARVEEGSKKLEEVELRLQQLTAQLARLHASERPSD